MMEIRVLSTFNVKPLFNSQFLADLLLSCIPLSSLLPKFSNSLCSLACNVVFMTSQRQQYFVFSLFIWKHLFCWRATRLNPLSKKQLRLDLKIVSVFVLFFGTHNIVMCVCVCSQLLITSQFW